MGWKTDFVEVEGAEETIAALHAWRVEKVPRIVRKGVKVGAVVMREAMRAETNFVGQSRTLPGGLLRGIKAASVRGTIAYDVGPMGKGTAHRHLVIRGHKVTRVRGGPVLGFARANPFVYRGQIRSEAEAQAAIAVAFDAAVAEVWRP